MADPTHTFGVASDPLGLAGETGKLEKFDLKGVVTRTTKGHAIHKDAMGEYVPATDVGFDEREEITVSYEANDNSAVGGGSIPVTLETNYAVTSIRVSSGQGRHATVEVTAHKHTGGTSAAHLANAREITLPSVTGFVATCLLGTAMTAAEVKDSEWTATVDHVDRPNNAGNFLCGKAVGVKIEAKTTGTCEAVPAVPGSWTLDSKDVTEASEDFKNVSIACHQYLAAEA